MTSVIDANEDDRVDRRFVSWVQPREPYWQQPVPTGDHRQARTSGEMNAGGGDGAHCHQHDAGGCDRASDGERACNPSRNVCGTGPIKIDRIITDESQDGAGARE